MYWMEVRSPDRCTGSTYLQYSLFYAATYNVVVVLLINGATDTIGVCGRELWVALVAMVI